MSVFFLIISGCSRGWINSPSQAPIDTPSQGNGDAAWEYEQKILSPVNGLVNTDQDLSLGDLQTNQVGVVVKQWALSSGTVITLQHPTTTPKVFGEQVQTLGAPIEINAGKLPIRLDEKAVITFAFDPTVVSTDTFPSELRVVYFNGQEWETIRPLSVDMTWGIVTFETYHFSLFGLNKIKEKTKLTEEWIHSKTLDEELKKNLNSASDHVANQIIDLTLQKMGITDKSLKGKILSDVLKDDSYKKIYDAYQKWDVAELNQRINLLASKKIVQNVPSSVFKTMLKETIDAKDDIEAVSKAAGFAVEWRYEDAARIIGENIADKFLLTTATKIAAEVMQWQIDSRKNKEVEAAYMAFKNGADGYFWWYNVDPGDFNSVWDQMRWIRRQLEIDAIAKENAIRRESWMPALTSVQEDMVREWVKASYEKQFALRKEREIEITKQEEKLRLIIAWFAQADFFDSTLWPVGLDKWYDYDSKLDVLDHFTRKMMDDTGRFDVSEKEWLLVDWALQITDIVQAARLYFWWPDGKKAYQKFLKDRFGIVIAPVLEDLQGEWNWTATVTAVELSEEAKAQVAKWEKPEGCEFDINLEDLIWQSNPITMIITPIGKEGGSLLMKSIDAEGWGDTQQTTFTYSEGVLTATISQEWVAGQINMTMSEEWKSLKWVWSLVAKYWSVATITIKLSITK
jgi:hypothetical protein